MEKKKNNHDPEFLKEKLKQRPLNRRKLLRRMLLTVLMAVLFGTVASVTILFLEPVISEYLYPAEDEPELIFFHEDIIEEEISPEDMIIDEREMQEIQLALEAENNTAAEDSEIDLDALIGRIATNILDRKEFGIDEHVSINKALMEISKEAQKSLVNVIGLTTDRNWINDTIESKEQTTGMIVWETRTSRELFILANIYLIRNSDSIEITFVNGKRYPAEIRHYDKTTGLAILSISLSQLNSETIEAIQVIELGNSSISSIIGSPVIAIGRIIANADSTCYGYITSTSNNIHMVDATYKLITTDIYGSTNASGVLINLRGQVIGIIDNSYNTSDAWNIISAIGVSELKNLITAMINNPGPPYIGIKGIDVTLEAHETLEVPRGAFITEVILDSPAMDAGLQMGDIIVKIEDVEIITFVGLINTIFNYKPEQNIKMTVKRYGPDGYREFGVEVTAGLLQ